jgi:alcohol dehydrogenase (NADP+)
MSRAINYPAPAAINRILAIANQVSNSFNPENNSKLEIMAAPSYKFQGWMGLDKSSVDGKLVWQEYEPKTWTEDDVDIKIAYCGICGSDLHTLRSGWVS